MMKEILTVVKYLYPVVAVLLVIFRSMLYPRMGKFYARLELLPSARNLYTTLLFGLLMLFNWCCYATKPGWDVAVALVLILPLVKHKWADGVLNRMHRSRLALTTLGVMALINLDSFFMYSTAVTLLWLTVAALFYRKPAMTNE